LDFVGIYKLKLLWIGIWCIGDYKRLFHMLK